MKPPLTCAAEDTALPLSADREAGKPYDIKASESPSRMTLEGCHAHRALAPAADSSDLALCCLMNEMCCRRHRALLAPLAYGFEGQPLGAFLLGFAFFDCQTEV